MKPTISLDKKHGRKFLWQWDLNMRIELGNVPAGTQIDFENWDDEHDGALPIMAYEEDGRVYANIPNKLLVTPGTLAVYVYLFDAEHGYTKLRKRFVIMGRSKPENYVYTETKVMTWQQLEERIKYLEEHGGGGSADDDGDNVVEFDGNDFGTSEDEEEEVVVF